jgi:hypothetical protein
MAGGTEKLFHVFPLPQSTKTNHDRIVGVAIPAKAGKTLPERVVTVCGHKEKDDNLVLRQLG